MNRSEVGTEEVVVNPWLVLFSVSLGLFMAVIDVSILNIALPSIAEDLHATMGSIQWTLIGYSLTLTGLVPVFGRISDVIGRKRLFILGVSIFALGSLFAALSGSIGWLITARIVQAFGGALITTNTLAIITDTFPAGKRGVAMGVQAILVSGGAAIGPTLGGFLVTHFGWESVFYVNIPIGVIATALAARVLPPLQSNRTLEPIDWAGAVTFIGGLTPILLAITKGSEWGWGSPWVLLLLGGGAAALIFFIMWELRVRFPLIDLSLFRIREFTAGQLAGVFASISMAGMMFLFPFYWQGLRGFSAQETGIFMLPLPLALMIVAPIAGRLSDTIGPRLLTSTGLSLVAVGLYFLSGITATMPIWGVVWRFLVFGMGLGMFMAPNNNSVMSSVPAEKRGVTSGLLGTFRFVGQGLGVAFGGAIFSAAMGGQGMPSPHTLASIHSPALLEAFRSTFVTALSTVVLATIPFTVVGVLLSLARGRVQSDPSPQEAPEG